MINGRCALRVRVVTDGAEFLELRAAWEEVARRSDNCSVFVTWEWVYTWLRYFGGRDNVNIVLVLDGESIVAIAPLLRTKVGRWPLGSEMLLPIGAEHADYSGFLLGGHPRQAARVIADYLDDEVKESGSIVHLSRFTDDDPMLEALRERLGPRRGSATIDERGVGTCPYLDLAGLPDASAEVARRKKRRDLPRRMRRLSERHEVEFHYHVGGEGLDKALSDVIRLHQVRWDEKADEMQGLFSDERGREFAVEVVRALDLSSQVRVSLITADGSLLAGCLGFEVGSRYHYHKPGFDPAFSNFKPGHLLIGELLDAAIESGVAEFNFGRGDDEYKARWTDRERGLVTVWLTRSRLRGRVQRPMTYRARRRRLAAPSGGLEGPWVALPALAPGKT